MTQPSRACSLGSLGSLDPMVNGNVQWTFELCQMAMWVAHVGLEQCAMDFCQHINLQ